jgi:hypothetical protein
MDLTVTNVLLILLISAVGYATYTLRSRMKQMDRLRVDMEKASKEPEQEEQPFEGMPISVLQVRPPTRDLNPRVVEIENELDKLYAERENGMRTLPSELWEKKEKELIGKMVDIFVKDVDRQFIHDSRTQSSGSK